MERRDLVDRLVPLIPPPRAHQVRYHGILAPGASLRERVVPTVAGDAIAAPASPSELPSAQACRANGERSRRRARMRWATLLARVFALDALRCPGCGSTLRLLAAIEDEAVARAILEHLDLPPRAPPVAPARPEAREPTPHIDDRFDFDQTPSYDEP
jgi:hypothetical protein